MPKSSPARTFKTFAFFTDKNGKKHIPPDPPCVDGLLPWQSPSDDFRRDEPLAKCPTRECRRLRRCVDKIKGKYCRKTNLDDDEWRNDLAARIRAMCDEEGGEDPVMTEEEEWENLAELRKELEKQHALNEQNELRKWQQAWADGMKAKEGAACAAPSKLTLR